MNVRTVIESSFQQREAKDGATLLLAALTSMMSGKNTLTSLTTAPDPPRLLALNPLAEASSNSLLTSALQDFTFPTYTWRHL